MLTRQNNNNKNKIFVEKCIVHSTDTCHKITISKMTQNKVQCQNIPVALCLTTTLSKHIINHSKPDMSIMPVTPPNTPLSYFHKHYQHTEHKE